MFLMFKRSTYNSFLPFFFPVTCCINKVVINFTTQGMHLVGQDEIVILLELDASNQLPKDIFVHLNDIYRDADKGSWSLSIECNQNKNLIVELVFRSSNHRTRILNGEFDTIFRFKRTWRISIHSNNVSGD